MAITITNSTLSGNKTAILAGGGVDVKITCSACGHVETQHGQVFEGDPKCPKCGATGRISMEIGAAQKE